MKRAEKIYDGMMNKVREICNQRGLSYYFLAKATGLSPSSISCLMRGETKPYLYTILRICEAIDISVEDLTQYEEESENEEEKQLLRTFRRLSPEKQKLLKTYIKMLQDYSGKM